MNKKRVVCENCGGRGYTMEYFIVPGVYDTDGFHKMQSEKKVCCNCNGEGYTEHAVFTVEEARAILKHCGLSTEVER